MDPGVLLQVLASRRVILTYKQILRVRERDGAAVEFESVAETIDALRAALSDGAYDGRICFVSICGVPRVGKSAVINLVVPGAGAISGQTDTARVTEGNAVL